MDNDKLFRLVSSLDGAEKRYFSIWCARHSGAENNLTLHLFRDLCALKKFDKKSFRTAAASKPYGKNLRFNKHFLYKQLLRCLHAFHAERNAEARIREMLDQADILSEKSLTEDALELLGTCSKLAMKYECYGIYYEIRRKELELFRDSGYKNVDKERMEHTEREIVSALQIAGSLVRTETTTMQLVNALYKGGIPRGELTTQAKTLGSTLLTAADRNSFRTNLLYLQGLAALEFSKENFTGAWKLMTRILDLFERFPHMREEKKKAWLVAVQNHLVVSNYIDRYEDLEATMEELQKIDADTPQLRNRVFYMTHNMMLGTCAHVGDFVRGLKLIREIKAAHKKGEVQHINLQNKLILLFNTALVYFGTGRYKEANASLQEIMAAEEAGVRDDLQSFTRIFSILIQLESGKQDLLEYSVRSAYRFLLKKKKLFEVEKVILHFIRHSAQHIHTEKERREGFVRLHKKLLPLSRRKDQQQPFRFFDLMAWLDSKINGKYFGTVLREKYPTYWKS